MNKSVLSPAKFSQRVLWYLLLGFSLYWLGNILAVFPWLLSKTLGIIAMFLSICFWGYMSYYSLRRVSVKDRTKDAIAMGICFLLTAVVQDFFLYAVYRGIPDELYEITTFLAYGLVFLIPFLVRYILLKKDKTPPVMAVSKTAHIITGLIGVCSLILTLWSIKLW